jgi:WD40 repeat protein
VIAFFEVIDASAPHIYHSALPLSPRESIVHKLYKPYSHPLARIVRGLPISWKSIPTLVRHLPDTEAAVWSPCSRFIAVAQPETIEIRDAVTLMPLHTFTHTSIGGTQWLSFSPDSGSLMQFSHGDNLLTTRDIQTGGLISAIPSTPNTSSSQYFSFAYSMDGKTLAAAHSGSDNTTVTVISTYNLLSGTHIYSHPVSEGRIVASIWTHGERLRFVTVKPGTITIWEVGFTSIHTLTEVESLPAPDNIGSEEALFLHTRSRLAFILREAVLIWDAQDSKALLNFVGDQQPIGISFSSDGRFFTCGTIGQDIHLWKESPTGYVLHKRLLSSIDKGTGSIYILGGETIPLLSPNGESIITSKYSETQLWRTTDPITPIPGVLTHPTERTDLILGFSPDKLFATTARLGENVATVVDLKSGDPRLIVDTGVKICGLGVTGNTVVVVGDGKITWRLPPGDRNLDARANIHDSVRTIVFDHPAPPPAMLYSAAISPDFNSFAITRGANEGLDIYDMSTGKHLAGTVIKDFRIPWFTRDGREIWASKIFPVEGWKIIKDTDSSDIRLQPLRSNKGPSGGYPWRSPQGNGVTKDGWIFNSRKKRSMWLPHHWRKYQRFMVWDGQFLGLLDDSLPEPIILELDE